MNNGVDLLVTDRAILTDILRTHLPEDVGVWAFGSRVIGTARRYSDLDLAVEADRVLDLAGLREALSESDLTIKVDIIDLRTVDPAFRRMIEADMVRLRVD